MKSLDRARNATATPGRAGWTATLNGCRRIADRSWDSTRAGSVSEFLFVQVRDVLGPARAGFRNVPPLQVWRTAAAVQVACPPQQNRGRACHSVRGDPGRKLVEAPPAGLPSGLSDWRDRRE